LLPASRFDWLEEPAAGAGTATAATNERNLDDIRRSGKIICLERSGAAINPPARGTAFHKIPAGSFI
jgi:hypothetical protein